MSGTKPQHETEMSFWTPSGVEVPAVTTEQMREIDRIAMEETGPNLFQMMENAGRNLAEITFEFLGANWRQKRIVVLAGSGGNGGGGIVAARHLANHGASVELCLAAPDKLGEIPAWQYKIFRATRGKDVSPRDLNKEPRPFILDALIGYGLESAPRASFAGLIAWANSTGAPTVSLDVPSGIDSTTGDAPGEFIHCVWTMTLALPKTGLGSGKAGQIVLADIGIPEEAYRRMGLTYVPPFGDRFRVQLSLRGNRPDLNLHM
jgi:NAD(P)H-hydrate epimerase